MSKNLESDAIWLKIKTRVDVQTQLPPFLSKYKVAELLGETTITIERMMKERTLPFCSIADIKIIPTYALMDAMAWYPVIETQKEEDGSST